MCLHCVSSPFDLSLCCEILPFSFPLLLTPLCLPPLFSITNTLLHHGDVHNVTMVKLPILLLETLQIRISHPEASCSEAEDAGTQIIKCIRLHPAVSGADSVHEEVD